MPQAGYSTIGGGGLNLAPRIIREPEDPYERALKAAKLSNLQNEDRFKERSLKLQELGLEDTRANNEALRRYQEAGLLENIRTNKAREFHENLTFGETLRFNQARERHDVDVLGENIRSNTARETEQNRSNLATDITAQRGQNFQRDANKEQQTAEITKTLISQLFSGADLENPQIRNRVTSVLKRLGYPQIGEGLAEADVLNSIATPETAAGAGEAIAGLAKSAPGYKPPPTGPEARPGSVYEYLTNPVNVQRAISNELRGTSTEYRQRQLENLKKKKPQQALLR